MFFIYDLLFQNRKFIAETAESSGLCLTTFVLTFGDDHVSAKLRLVGHKTFPLWPQEEMPPSLGRPHILVETPL